MGGIPDLGIFPQNFPENFFLLHTCYCGGIPVILTGIWGGYGGRAPHIGVEGGVPKGGLLITLVIPPFLWISLFVGVEGVPYLCEFAICVPHLRTSNGSISGYFS